MEHLNHIGYKIIGCIYNVYNELGPGLLESIYETALMVELKEQDLRASNQVPIEVTYKGQDLGLGMRMDILVEDAVIIELKSVETLMPIHHKQLLTYMRLANKRLGYLVNFNSDNIQNNIKRKIL